MSRIAPLGERLAEVEAELATLRERLAEAEQDTDRTLLRATRLAQIVSALGQIDPSGRIARVAGEVAELFTSEIGLLLLGSDDALTVAGRWGISSTDLPDVVCAAPAGLGDGDVVAGRVPDVPVLDEVVAFDALHVAWIRLRVPDRSLGLLCLVRCHDQPFTSSDAHELRAVGARVALAVENADLQRRTGEQLEQLRVLHALSAELAGTVVSEEAARLTVDALRSLAPEATIAVYQASEGGLTRIAAGGDTELPELLSRAFPDCDDPDVEVLALRDGAELVGAVAMRGMPRDGIARPALPHVQHVVGLALGKTVLHERTAEQARHDGLTGLPNRFYLGERIRDALAQSHRVAVIFLDLDRFKVINDSLGHDAGDELLVEVARRLRRSVRPGDSVARIGGDEFVVLCDGIASAREAARVARRIGGAIAEPFEIAGTLLHVTTSQGIALSETGATADTLLRDADAAMYRAKSRGKDRFEVFDQALRDDVTARLAAEQAIHDAVREHRLCARYQPVVDLQDGRIGAVEAVLCYEQPDGALVTAPAFVPVAEESDLIVTLGRWLGRRACQDMARWVEQFADDAPSRVLVNVSGRELARGDHLDAVRSALRDANIPAHRLGLELTESVLMHGGDRVRRALHELHRDGVGIAMDDFGNGYSSLTFLREFPIDLVKIGREFVPGLVDDDEDVAIVAAVARLAEALDLRCAVEGVTDDAQVRVLRDLGCHNAQGPRFGELWTAAQVEAHVAASAGPSLMVARAP